MAPPIAHCPFAVSLPLPISGSSGMACLAMAAATTERHSHHVTICNMTQLKSPAERNPDLTGLVPYSLLAHLARHLGTAMTSTTGGTRKSPEQGRPRKAAIGVGSQKCCRAGGQTRMAQVTSRLCLNNALSNPTRLAQEGWGLGERRYHRSFDWSAHRTSNNRHTATRMTET